MLTTYRLNQKKKFYSQKTLKMTNFRLLQNRKVITVVFIFVMWYVPEKNSIKCATPRPVILLLRYKNNYMHVHRTTIRGRPSVIASDLARFYKTIKL